MKPIFYILSSVVLAGAVAATAFLVLPGALGTDTGAESIDETLSIEDRRNALISLIDDREIPGPDQIRATASALFALPTSEQSERKLRDLARDANLYANMISRITDEYDQAFRSEVRYDFIRDKIQEKADPFLFMKNEFLGIRNRAYLNLGLLLKEEGRNTEAFFTFSDAHRLSPFRCFDVENAETNCVRLIAEEEMKELLNISNLNSYIDWGAHRD